MDDTSTDDLGWLMKWYAANCDGEWEHNYGVTIETLDNPGWRILIDLRKTTLEGRPFETVSFNLEASERGDHAHWLECQVQDQKFVGAGGTFDLIPIVRVFRNWVEQQ